MPGEPRSEIASRIVAKHRERQAAESTVLAAADKVLRKLPEADRHEFSNLLSGGFGSSAGATTYRLLADWSVGLSDPNDDWKADAHTLAARAWDLIQNDPNARALVECMTLGVLGDCGLRFRSLYQADLNGETSDAELEFRRTIENVLSLARSGCGVDAAGALSSRDFTAQLLTSMLASGDGFAIRVWSPRAESLLSQRWRILAPERVSNPEGKPNTPTLFEGIEYDAAGAPTALHVRTTHPISSQNKGAARWERIDWRAPDGSLNVLHLFKPMRPGQRRGISWFAPLLVLAQHLSKTVEAFVVAKRTQACLPAIVKTDDPLATANAAKAGALLGPHTKWRPNTIAYTSLNSEVIFPSWQFNGSDYRDFLDVNLRAFAACWGLPFQFVMQQLTEANLASAQVALDQADKTFSALQDLVICKVERPIDEALLREGVARKLIVPGAGTTPAMLNAARYLRPRRPDANKQRTRDAALLFIDMGGSRTTAFSEMGYDFEEETLLRKQNDDFQKKHGVVIALPPADVPKAPNEAAPVKTSAAADVRSITFLRDATGRINGLTRVEGPDAL